MKKKYLKIGIIIFIIGVILSAIGSYGYNSISHTHNSINQDVFILDTQEKVNTYYISATCITIGILTLILGILLIIIGFFLKENEYIPVKKSNRLCTNCGHEIPSDALICPYCGKKILEEKISERICPKCGHYIPFDSSICPYCEYMFWERKNMVKCKHYKPSIIEQKTTQGVEYAKSGICKLYHEIPMGCCTESCPYFEPLR